MKLRALCPSTPEEIVQLLSLGLAMSCKTRHLSRLEIVQLLSLGLAVSCKMRHLSRAAGEVAALAAGGCLFEHRSGLAFHPP